MAGKNDIEAGIRLEGETEFKSAVTSVNKSLTSMKSEMSLVSAECEGQANTLDSLSKKQEVLNRILEEQKKKVSTTKEGLDHAKESYENVGNGLEKLWTDLEKATDKLQDMNKIYGEGSEEAKKQRMEVLELSAAIEKGESNYQKAGDKVKDWEVKLNTAEAQVIRASKEVNKNSAYMREAENSTDRCATSIDAFGKEVKGAQTEIKNWGDGIKQHLKTEVIMAGIRSLVGVLKEGSQAIVGLATDAAAYADEILTTSVVTRMSTDDLQAYNYAAELVDVSLDTLTKSMAKNVKSMTNAQRGSAEYVKAYERLGVSVTDGNGKLLDSEAVYWKCIDALKNMTDETERDSVSMQIFGKSAQELNPLIAQGSEGIKKLSDEAREMGAVLDSDALSALGATDDSLQRLYQTVDIFKRKVGAEMAPSITKASDEITKTIAGLDDEVADFAAGALEDAVSLFQWIIENHKVITSGLKGIVAGLVMYKAVDAITNVITAMQALRKATAAAETAQLALNASQAINPYALLAAGITAVVVGIGSFIGSLDDTNEVLDENQQVVQNCLDQYSQLSEAVQKSSDSHAENITNLQQEYGAYDVLAQKLADLSEKENKSAGDKALMASYVDQLNEKIPDLNLAIDETTGSLNMETDALLNSVSAMKQKAESAAWGERLTKLAEERIEIEEKRKAAMEAQTAAENKQKEAEKQHGITYEQIMEKLKGINSITAQKYELQKEDNKAVMDAADSVTTAKGAIMNYDKVLEENGIKADEAAGKIKELGGAASETGDVIKEASEKAAEAASVNAEIQKQALESVQGKFEETKASIQQSLEQKINMFDVFSGGEDMSVEKMLENLDSQLKGIENYKVNLETIKDQVGKTIAPEFLQYIEDMGTDGANTLEHMVATLNQDNGAELLKEMSDKYVKALDVTEEIAEKGAANKTAMEIANGKLGSTKADFSGLRDSINKAVSDATAGWSELPDNTRNELDRVIQVAQETGVKIPDGLAESIKSGETSPTEAINQMNSAISGTFEGLVSIAQEAGITIPDGIKDGIASGGDTAIKAYQELIQLLQQTGVESETNAQQSGKTSADKYAESMQAQSGTVKNAGSSVAKSGIDGINSHQGEFQQSGANMMQSMANGIAGGAYQVSAQAGAAASGANNSASLYYNAFSGTGGNLALGLANGFIANAPAVAAAARAAVAKAVAAAKKEGGVASPSKVFRKEVGIHLPKGMELGIKDGTPGVARSAREMARAAIDASKKEFDVNSPIRVFIKIGKNLGEGLEIGVKGKTKAAVKASSKMAKEVYKEASSWLTTYKKTHDVTLAQEESFWRKVARTVKKGTNEYKAAVKSANSLKSFERQVNSNVDNKFGVSRTEVKNKKTVDKDEKKYYSELTKAATTYIENKKKTNKISLQQEKYFWEQVKKGAGETTQTYADASGKVKAINKKIKDGIDAENKKIEEKEKAAAEKAVSRLENSIASKKKYSSLTAAEETAMWDNLIKEAEKKGGKYLKVVQKQAKAAKKEIEQANKEYGLSGSGLDSYKTYYNVSAKAEMEYWEIVRKNRKLTNAQRIEADQKYLEAKKNYNEQMKDLEDDYYDKCKDVSEKLADDIKEATEKYNEAVADRKDAIKSAFSMFDAFKSESESKEQLLANAESQAAGYALWMQQLEELSSKGIVNDKSMEELRKMGPEATAHIVALNSMTEEELKQINASWEKKDQIAEAQAVKENEALRKQTEENIKTMKAEAQKKLDAYKVEYDNASKVLSEAMEAPLRELANNALTLGSDATAKFILGVGNAAKSSDATKALKGATRQLAKGLDSLPKAGKEIGKDTLAGILNGMSNKLEIKKGAKSIVAELEKAIKKEAGINSPSRRFKESIGLQIPAGVAQGVEEGAGKASRSGAQMIRTMLEKSKTQLKDQQSALADYSSKLNWSGGIEALNRIISVSPTQVQNIKVDNSGMSGMFNNMIAMLQELNSNMGNMQVVLEDGTLVGKIAPAVGNELAARTMRWI